ncbi:hypothetical protein C7475_1011148 [Chitinophaga sp. S165]|nr:hypothetical protein C7475_1011148 [Chitinophaga sp. S165]
MGNNVSQGENALILFDGRYGDDGGRGMIINCRWDFRGIPVRVPFAFRWRFRSGPRGCPPGRTTGDPYRGPIVFC